MPEPEHTPEMPEPEHTPEMPEPEHTPEMPEPEHTPEMPEPERTPEMPEPALAYAHSADRPWPERKFDRAGRTCPIQHRRNRAPAKALARLLRRQSCTLQVLEPRSRRYCRRL